MTLYAQCASGYGVRGAWGLVDEVRYPMIMVTTMGDYSQRAYDYFRWTFKIDWVLLDLRILSYKEVPHHYFYFGPFFEETWFDKRTGKTIKIYYP